MKHPPPLDEPPLLAGVDEAVGTARPEGSTKMPFTVPSTSPGPPSARASFMRLRSGLNSAKAEKSSQTDRTLSYLYQREPSGAGADRCTVTPTS
jgi:hypothetical protein